MVESKMNEKIEKIKPKMSLVCDTSIINRFLLRAEPLNDEIRPFFKKEGLHIRVIDGAYVAMYDAFIEKIVFDRYELNADTRISFEISRLLLAIGLSDEKTMLSFDADNDKRLHVNNFAKIGLNGNKKKDLDMPDKMSDDIQMVVSDSDIALIKNLMKIGSEISDSICFETDIDKILYICIKGDIDDYRIPLSDKPFIKEHVTLPCRSKYSVHYLADIFKHFTKDDTIEIKYGHDKNIQISQKMDHESHLFIIAPRIESEN